MKDKFPKKWHQYGHKHNPLSHYVTHFEDKDQVYIVHKVWWVSKRRWEYKVTALWVMQEFDWKERD